MIIRILHGDKITIRNNRLIILNNINSDGEILETEEKNSIPLKDIRAIIIENPYSSISISALLELNRNKINLIICNEKFQPELQVLNLFSNYKITERINEQINWKDEEKTKAFKKIIIQKISHQSELLEFIGATKEKDELLNLIENLENKNNIASQEIVSIEGVAARIYFQKLFLSEFKRFQNDLTNSALNYGYTIVRTLVSKIIVAKGLHPTLGIQHSSVFNNYNLVDDLMEIFRPMVDYIVYFNFQKINDESLLKEHRNELLKIYFQKIEIEGKLNTIDYAVEKYIDNFIGFMNKTKENFELPKLVISKYEY